MQSPRKPIPKPDGWKYVSAIAKKYRFTVSIHFRPNTGRQVNFSKKTNRKQKKPFVVASYWPEHGTLRIGPWRRHAESLKEAWELVSKMT